MRINLTAEGKNEKIVLDWLEKNAPDTLCEKINSCGKTMADCWNFIVSKAKKEATKGCACISDSKVFGWAMHFFQEDDIKVEPLPENVRVETVAPKPKEKKPTRTDESQMQISMF